MKMSRKTEEIRCPRNPDHGVTMKRWLRGDYKQGGTGDHALIADVFEINCQTCGKYEYRELCSAKKAEKPIRWA